MNINIKNYIVCGESKVNTDILSFFCNLLKWGNDLDIIRMWVKDESMNQFGVDLEKFEMEII